MRHLCLALSAACAIALSSIPMSGHAQSSLPQTYDVALRCFVANVRAEGIERRAGRISEAERYVAAGRQAFEAMSTVGVALGKSRQQMEADIRAGQERELPRMVQDTDYYRAITANCRAYGLMPSAS